MTFIKFIAFISILFCLCSQLKAVPTLDVQKDSLQYIGQHIAVFEHPDDLPIQYIDSINFYQNRMNADIIRLGESNAYFWLKFNIKNRLNSPLQLSIDQALINYLKLYKKLNNGEYEITEIGEHLPFHKRLYQHPVYIFDLNLPKDSMATYYLQIKSDESNTLPIAVSSTQKLQSYLSNKDLFIGCFLGLIIVMFFYNLMLFIKIRDKNYLYYVLYLFAICLTQLSVQGYTFKYFWPNSPFIAQHITIFLACCTTVFAILFVQSFLKTKQNHIYFHRALNVFCYSFIIPVLFLFLGNFYWAFNSLSILTAILTLIVLFIAYYNVYKGYTPALNFALGWTFLLLFTLGFVLRDIGVLPHNFLTFYGVIIGSCIEAIFLSFALADRINNYRNKLLKSTLEKEEILKQQNAKLELLVQNRTQEISANLSKIESQNTEKAILLKEIHHRVKNNLQIITSLLSLQHQNIKELPLKQIFTSSQMRINSMAIIHELLYQSNDFSKIDYQDYLQHLTQSLLHSFSKPNQKIDIIIEAQDIEFNLETAIPLGLIINEAVTNIFKHALHQKEVGSLKISIQTAENDNYTMRIQDNGKGMPDDFDIRKSNSLGTKLISKLVRQLLGTVRYESSAQGTTLFFKFKQIE